MGADIPYWQVPMNPGTDPIRIVERTNQKADMHTSDWSAHWHESLELQYILEGSATFFCGDQYETLMPGDVMFAGWCVPHTTMDFEDGTRYYVIQLNPSFLLSDAEGGQLARYQDLLSVDAFAFARFIRQDGVLTQLLQRIIRAWTDQPFGWDLEFKSALLGLFHHLFTRHYHPACQHAAAGTGSRSLRCAVGVMEYLYHHYREVIRLEDLSARLGVSKSYLCNSFRTHTGKTISAYTNERRCFMACTLLSSGVGISQAAASVGFNDYNYFSRTFKKIVGASPSEYQSRLRQTQKKDP